MVAAILLQPGRHLSRSEADGPRLRSRYDGNNPLGYLALRADTARSRAIVDTGTLRGNRIQRAARDLPRITFAAPTSTAFPPAGPAPAAAPRPAHAEAS